jgi:DNA polymerase V
MSRRVMETLAAPAPELEIYSIDKAFLNLTGLESWGLADYARLIRTTVRRDTGIPVSIGIGPTKTLAKIANHLAKAHPAARGHGRCPPG